MLFVAHTHMVINGRQLKPGELVEMPNVYHHHKLLEEIKKRSEDTKKIQREAVGKALRKGLKPIIEEPKKSPKKIIRKVRCL